MAEPTAWANPIDHPLAVAAGVGMLLGSLLAGGRRSA